MLCYQLKKRGLRFIQSADTLVMHHLALPGREGGYFSHFTDKKQYYKALIDSRVNVLFGVSKLRLAVLPLLDVVCILPLLYKLATRQYIPSRLEQVNKETRLFSLSSVRSIFQCIISSYLVGYYKLILELRIFSALKDRHN